jgi:hypothetical protein
MVSQKTFDDRFVHIAETTISPPEPIVKVSEETEMQPNRFGPIALFLELCDVRLNIGTQRAVVQASNRFELSE